MPIELPQITYIFGAGASALVMPTIKQLPERIIAIRNFIEANYVYGEDEVFNVHNRITFKKNDAKEFLLEGLARLADFSSKHSTVDTYAKKLMLRGSYQDAEELIFCLAVYFNLEQKLTGVDPRYDTFLVSILDSSFFKFPNNLKFLSWNYDLQMEAAHELIGSENSEDIGFRTFNDIFPELQTNEFVSIKLNGSCNYADSWKRNFRSLVKRILSKEIQHDDIDLALQLGYVEIKKASRIIDGGVSLNFAWHQDNERLQKICSLYSKTNVLVVIGYSFPFFNRKIDREIIRGMEKLKTIYIQDKIPNNIKTRFLSILPDWKLKGIDIIPVEDTSEFFLPPEL